MKLQDIKTICCIGAGLIGSSWATLYARFELDVRIYDPFEESLKSAEKKIRDNYEIFVRNGFMTEKEVETAFDRIQFISELEPALRDAQFVQESVPERLDLKRQLVRKIDEINPAAIVCSSTSGLNISDIAGESLYPERYIGGHPYNPPHLMPLVELTRWERTDEDCLRLAYDFYRSVRKEPVILNKESPGFIGNRLQGAFVKEAVEIVSEGICSVEDLDRAAVYGLGIRWAILGPNLNGELNGGEEGIRGYFGGKFKSAWDASFRRLLASKMTEVPEEYYTKIAPEGVAGEKRNRLPETGNTTEEIAAYRDKLLLEILRLHGKI